MKLTVIFVINLFLKEIDMLNTIVVIVTLLKHENSM